jgi:dynein heavy chain
LEGAKWDPDTNALCEPPVMELTVMMPVLWFKPITKKKPPANMYMCPAYYYPTRTGTVYKDSFQMWIDLKAGEKSSDFWIKRGTAILMSTAN